MQSKGEVIILATVYSQKELHPGETSEKTSRTERLVLKDTKREEEGGTEGHF